MTDVNALESALGGKIVQMDFKPFEDVALEEHEKQALLAVTEKAEAAKAAAEDAQKRFQQAQNDFQQAQSAMNVANIQQATIFELTLRRVNRFGKQFWYKAEDNSLVVDPN